MELQNFKRNALIENRWLTLLEDRYNLPNGTECIYYHAYQNDAVMAIAIEQSGSKISTYIVNQYRDPIGESIWQFPLGGFDLNTIDAVEAARQELSGETGLIVGNIKNMGSFYANPGFTNQRVHVCVTCDISKKTSPKLDDTEYGLVTRKVPITEIAGLISSGEMGDAWGIIGLHYLNLYVAEFFRINVDANTGRTKSTR